MKIKYVTGNANKYNFAKRMLPTFEVEQVILDIPEIQGENYLEISIDKAKKAFQILQEPLFITDTSWEVPGLKGFPGPYMKSVSKWFEAQDFLNLMRDKKDKSIKLIDNIIYIDKSGVKNFECVLVGEFAEDVLEGDGTVIHNLVKFGDKYIREYTKENAVIPGEGLAWEKFVEFLNNVVGKST